MSNATLTLNEFASNQLAAIPAELKHSTCLLFTATITFGGRKPFVRKHTSLSALREDTLKLLRGHYAFAEKDGASTEVLQDIAKDAVVLNHDDTIPMTFNTHRFKAEFWVTIERAKLGQNGSAPF